MASLAAARGAIPGPAIKQIPLLCTVCPEAPRFSDVSHLLTHIASKGHLHHETQTRLKSHQDLAATVALQQYELWYKDNGIETLLVERMKAKQLKEAAKIRRARGHTPAPSLKARVIHRDKRLKADTSDFEKQAKRRTKRPASSATVKSEQDDFAQDFPLFPGFFPSDNDAEGQDDLFAANDMLSLKGQIWPGMGKMDLANEDMKRTRNQRKPNSVIEKMRRISEGIEPTQVVMTSGLEVERIKGVYDSSSPIPGQEEETPKKVVKTKRKRSEALTEISANVPRGGNRRSARNSLANSNKISHLKSDYDHGTSSDLTPSLGAFRHGHDVFRDDDGGSGLYEERPFATPTHLNQKFDTRERLGLHALNPISHSNVVSPTPSSRDNSARLLSARESHRGRTQAHGYLGHSNHMNLGKSLEAGRNESFPKVKHADRGQGSLSQADSYGFTDASMYNNPTRLSFAASNHFNAIAQDSFRLSNGHLQPKHEDYSSTTGDSLSNSSSSQFLTMSESNPLFSQDGLFLTSYHQSNTNQSLSSLGFTPINRGRDHSHGPHDQGHRPPGANIKLEAQLCEGVDNGLPGDSKQPSFTVNGLWDSQTPETGVELHEDLEDEELDI